MKTHKDLDVWNLRIALVERIYILTQKYPKEELYGLTNQIRRSAVSIPSNIAEGAARNSNKEYIQFLYISLGSASELETQLIIAQKLNYQTQPEVFDDLERIRKMLIKLIQYQKARDTNT